ncbi:MAG: GDSL-type esterase/lipase family protein, partial [Angelakisella sp.]
VIGFGMNDSGAGISLGEYKDNLQAILQTTRAGNPAAEFILISPTVPSPDCQGWTKLQPSYQQALETLAQELRGVVVAPMTKVQQFLLSRKRYADVSGNGVNHPNDFMARIHAQVIVQCLL